MLAYRAAQKCIFFNTATEHGRHVGALADQF